MVDDLDDDLLPNRISATISDGTIEEIQKGLLEIKSKLPFLVRFLEDNRPYVLEIGENLIPFIDQSMKDGRAYPNLVPPFVDIEELERDLLLFQRLQHLLKPIQELADLLHDTAMAAGSDAFETAVVFYKRVRMGARLGDTEAQEVMQHFRDRLPEFKQGGRIHVG